MPRHRDVRSIEGYGRVLGKDARIALLRSIDDVVIELHVPLAIEHTHRGRLVKDLPRRVAAAGRVFGEPGDRGREHVFFDDEAPIREAAAAGFAFVKRRGAWLVFERGTPLLDAADSFAREVLRVLRVMNDVERARRSSPETALRALRARRSRVRGPIGRARLRRAIGWVDALMGQNCYRRVLAETALDGGAARETLVFGLDVGRTGHVAFADTEERTFDVLFEL